MAKRTAFRAQERRSVRLGAALRDPRLGWVREARVVDLHLFGAGLEMPDPPEVGTVVLVELSAPSLWDPLRLPGTVVWTKPGASRGPARLGVRFDHALPEPLLPLFDLLADVVGFDLRPAAAIFAARGDVTASPPPAALTCTPAASPGASPEPTKGPLNGRFFVQEAAR